MNRTEIEKELVEHLLKIKDKPVKYIAFVVSTLVLLERETLQDEVMYHACHLYEEYTREQFEKAEKFLVSQAEEYKENGQEFIYDVKAKELIELAEASAVFIREHFLFPDSDKREASA